MRKIGIFFFSLVVSALACSLPAFSDNAGGTTVPAPTAKAMVPAAAAPGITTPPTVDELTALQQLQQAALAKQAKNGGDIQVFSSQVDLKREQAVQDEITRLKKVLASTPSDVAASANSSVQDDIFAGVVNKVLPISPQQIASLRELYNETQKTAAQSSMPAPKPTASSKGVDLSPGATPPVVRLSSGFISSLVFLDATGSPWPIKAYSLGDPNSYNVQWDQEGNTLLVQALNDFKSGNVAVMLKDLNTPVMVTLLPGQKSVDYRVDLQVPAIGPNSSQDTDLGALKKSNPLLLDVLDGIPPSGSQLLSVSGGPCQVWLLNNKLYVRTSMTLLSPGWIAKVSSADGTHAYEMQKAPVLLASQHGRIIQLVIEDLQ